MIAPLVSRAIRRALAALFVLILAAFPIPPRAHAALDPEEVLVIVNGDDPDSVRIGKAYLDKRGVPEKNLCRLAIGKKRIGRDEYNAQVRDVVEKHIVDNGLKDTIRCLLTVSGTPYVVGRGRKDPALAAVDNELTLLFRRGHPARGWVNNPLYFAANPELNLPAPPQGIYLVSRLESVDADTTIALVDKALAAEKNGLAGTGYFDTRGLRGRSGYAAGDVWVREARRWVAGAGYKTVIDNKGSLFPKGSTPDAAFYFGWYRHSRFHDSFDKTFPPGAIAVHIASFEARDLQEGTGWCKRLLEDGATATAGPVEEPYLFSFMQYGMFWRAILTGHSYAEAFWLSVPLTSWRVICLGDPLYTPMKNHPRPLLTVEPLGVKRQDDADGLGVARWSSTVRPVFELTWRAPTDTVAPMEPIERLTWRLESNDGRVESVEADAVVIENLRPGETRRIAPGAITLKSRNAAPAPPGPDDSEALLTWTAEDDRGRTWSVPLRLPVGYRRLVGTLRPETFPEVDRTGTRLACSDGRNVILRNLITGDDRPVATLPEGTEPHGMAFGPNARYLAVVTKKPAPPRTPEEKIETTSRVVDLVEGRTVEGPQLVGVRYLGVDASGNLYYRSKEAVTRFEPAADREALLFRTDANAVYSLAPTCDKALRYRPAAGDRAPELELIDLKGQTIKRYENLFPATAEEAPEFSWSANGRRFSIAQHNGRIDVIDVEAGRMAGFPEAGRNARLDPTGERLALEAIRVRRFETGGDGAKPRAAGAQIVTGPSWTERPWFAPGGEGVVVRTPTSLEIRKSLEGEPSAVAMAMGPRDRIAVLAWSWDGARVAFRVEGAREENLLYDVEQKTLKRIAPGTAITGLTWAADNSHLYLSTPGLLLRHDLAAAKAEKMLEVKRGNVYWPAPDGSIVARIAGGNRLHLHAPDGKLLRTVKGRIGPGARLRWSGDSRHAWIVNARGVLTRWTIPDPEKLIDKDGKPTDVKIERTRLASGVHHLSVLGDGGAAWFDVDRLLRRHDRAGGESRNVAAAAGFRVQWTPDGRTLCGAMSDGGGYELFAFTEGGALHRLGDMNALGNLRAPTAWTNRTGIVSSNREGTFDLWETAW